MTLKQDEAMGCQATGMITEDQDACFKKAIIRKLKRNDEGDGYDWASWDN